MIPRGRASTFTVGDAVAPWGDRAANPYGAFNFAIQLEGLVVAGCTAVSGIEAAIQTEAYAEGGANGFVHQLPQRTVFPNLTLTRGMTGNGYLWQWFDNVSRGAVVRRNGTIVVLDERQSPVMWWNFRGAYPVRWAGPDLDAMTGAVAFEQVELAHEGLTQPILSQTAQMTRGM